MNRPQDPTPTEIAAMCELIQASWTPAAERHRRLNNPAWKEIVTPEQFRVPTVRVDRDIRPADGAGNDL